MTPLTIRFSKILGVATLLVGCKHAATTPSRDVRVATVKDQPPAAIDTKPKCGPEHEIGTIELADAIGLPIRAICIRGAGEDHRDDVRSYLRLKEGSTLDEERLHRDVTALFDSGFFRRVDVLARAQENGIELTYDLELRPVIKSVQVIGTAEIGPEDSIRALVGSPYAPAGFAHQVDALRSREDVDVEVLVIPAWKSVNIALDVKKH